MGSIFKKIKKGIAGGPIKGGKKLLKLKHPTKLGGKKIFPFPKTPSMPAFGGSGNGGGSNMGGTQAAPAVSIMPVGVQSPFITRVGGEAPDMGVMAPAAGLVGPSVEPASYDSGGGKVGITLGIVAVVAVVGFLILRRK